MHSTEGYWVHIYIYMCVYDQLYIDMGVLLACMSLKERYGFVVNYEYIMLKDESLIFIVRMFFTKKKYCMGKIEFLEI